MPRILTQPESERRQVERWREEELLRAGYAADAAEVLSMLPDVDIHVAVALLRAGCEPDLAVEILL